MMASLFLTFTLSLLSLYLRRRPFAIFFLIIGLIGGAFMLWYHATDTLRINW